MLTATDLSSSSLIALFALILTVCGLVAAVGGFISRRNTANTALQDSTITSLEATITALQADGALKSEQIETLKHRCQDLETQLRYLNRQVLQAAKVDELRAEVGEARDLIMNQLHLLAARWPD